jgi:hypothetical protein
MALQTVIIKRVYGKSYYKKKYLMNKLGAKCRKKLETLV